MPPLDNANNEAEYANHIPEGVRRQAARADAIARELGAANVPNLAAPPADLQPELPLAAAPADPAPTADPTPQPAEWEQRYRTLQGKYDAEVPGLRNQLAQMQGQVASFERLIATMQTPAPAPAQPTTPAPAPATTTVVAPPKEDVETYGQDLIDASMRWAATKFGPEIERLVGRLGAAEAKITELTSGHRQVETVTARQSVQNRLDRDPAIGPTWRQVNERPEFIAWLQHADPFTGQKRVRLLQEAYNGGDAERTAAFFRAFNAEHTAVTPPAAAPVQTPAPGADRPTLESMAAPGRTSGPAPVGAPAGKRVWTRAEITAFFRDRTQGKWDGREADASRIEHDIHAAIGEGRIQ